MMWMARWNFPWRSLPLRKCGLKWPSSVHWNPSDSHFPCGSVDWNHEYRWKPMTTDRHFPCGSVDWNINQSHLLYLLKVTSLAEVWIEMSYCWNNSVVSMSLPLRKCGLKSSRHRHLRPSRQSHFPCGSVDWNMNIVEMMDNFAVTSLAEVWIEIGYGAR